jgi:hypothetical protein
LWTEKLQVLQVIISQFISVLIYLHPNPTVQRPITELAGARRKRKQQNTTNKIKTKWFI